MERGQMSRTAYRTCPLCEAVCGLELTIDDGRVTSVRGDASDPFSKGFICPKGATFGRLDGDPDRLAAPMMRDGGPHLETDWEHAFELVGRGLRRVIEEYGRDSVAIYFGNPNAHTLAGPLYTAALIRALGTRNVYSASTADQMPKHVSSGHMFGNPMAIPVPDLDRTDYLLMLGANPLESNGSLCSAPDFPGRLKALRGRGGRLVVVDPRRTRTARLGDEHLFIRPGTDALFLFGLVHTLFADDLIRLGHRADDLVRLGHRTDDVAGLGYRVNGLDDLRALAVDFSPEAVAPATGIPAATTRRIARELAAAPTAAVYARIGTCTQAYGTLASWLVDVLNTLTGNLDREGGAMFPRPAHVPVYRNRRRAYTTGRWHSRVASLPEVNGELPVATLADEIETPGEGQIRALITIGGNPVLSAPGGDRLDRALPGLEFMVSVDPYLNETTRHADVILPPPRPAQSAHFDLLLLGFTVRDYARYSPPAVPLPEGRPDEAAILARLSVLASGLEADPSALDELIISRTLGKAVELPESPVHGRKPEELRSMLEGADGAELRLDMMLRLGPYGDGFGADPGGLTLARLRDEHPHGIDLGPLRPRLDEVLETVSGRVELCPPTFAADVDRLRTALEGTGPDFLLIGRRQLRSNNSWLHNVPELVGGSNRCTLQLNPEDARRLGVGAGDMLRVISRSGTITAQAEPTDEVMRGVVSLPHGWGHDRPGTRTRTATENAGVSVNGVTDEQEIDPLSGNAVFNGVPVRLEPLLEGAPA
jgi:anaerobic selenocysteine-containing dehydrogenase